MIYSYTFLVAFCLPCVYSFSSTNTFASTIKSMELTENQLKYYTLLKDDETPIVVCTGVSGTGKSTLAVLHSLSEIKKKNKDQIILTRPSVLVDADNFGALPGSINEKMQPLFNHICEIIGEEHGSSANLYNIIKDNKIKIIPLEYIRGNNCKNCILLCDEMQNSTIRQMKALLTRTGVNCKVIIIGDYEQSDLNCENGLKDFVNKYIYYTKKTIADFIKTIELTEDDIKRSDIIKEVLNIYK